jgi:hypothetical protein
MQNENNQLLAKTVLYSSEQVCKMANCPKTFLNSLTQIQRGKKKPIIQAEISGGQGGKALFSFRQAAHVVLAKAMSDLEQPRNLLLAAIAAADNFQAKAILYPHPFDYEFIRKRKSIPNSIEFKLNIYSNKEYYLVDFKHSYPSAEKKIIQATLSSNQRDKLISDACGYICLDLIKMMDQVIARKGWQ